MKCYGITNWYASETNRFLVKQIYDYGIYKVGDFYDSGGDLKIEKESLFSAISPDDNFLFTQYVKLIPTSMA